MSSEQSSLSSSAAMRPVRVEYYAQLREEAGRAKETVQTAAPTASALFEELDRRHGFSLSAEDLRVSINASFADWDAPVDAEDLVVFIPPVAGG